MTESELFSVLLGKAKHSVKTTFWGTKASGSLSTASSTRLEDDLASFALAGEVEEQLVGELAALKAAHYGDLLSTFTLLPVAYWPTRLTTDEVAERLGERLAGLGDAVGLAAVLEPRVFGAGDVFGAIVEFTDGRGDRERMQLAAELSDLLGTDIDVLDRDDLRDLGLSEALFSAHIIVDRDGLIGSAAPTTA